ncbi:AbrB family transcriptional regulator [Clostridia bacterium]|nr:AbrB family transcriptional regulator [Clostridia bacterium]
MMKSTGLVKRLDELGRIVIPVDIRRTFGLQSPSKDGAGDSIEFFTEDDKIILRKYQPADIFTGSMENLVEYRGRKVSKDTIIELAELADLKIDK